MRTVARVLQGLDKECQRCVVSLVGSEFTHAVSSSAIGVLISHRQYLVGLQRGFQGDITQGTVQRVFRRCQQSGCSQFLIVLATSEGSFQHRACLVNVTGSHKSGCQLPVFIVGDILGL